MSICVIFNPTAGRQGSGPRWRHIQKRLGNRAEFISSEEPGHAEWLAFNAVRDGFSTVVAAGGDGTVHEVANGVIRADQPEAVFGLLPLGSGNDYAAALQLPRDVDYLCECLYSNLSRRVDVGQVVDERGRSRYFVNTLGLGLSGAVCYEAKKIKGLRGLPLYGLAAIQAILRRFQAHDSTLVIDDNRSATATLYLAVALGQREGGGFVIAPEAKLDDGLFDYLHAGRLSRWQALRYLPRLALGRLPENHAAIRRGQCRRLSLQSADPLLIHLDGELFAWPEDDVRRVDIHILPLALRVRAPPPTP